MNERRRRRKTLLFILIELQEFSIPGLFRPKNAKMKLSDI